MAAMICSSFMPTRIVPTLSLYISRSFMALSKSIPSVDENIRFPFASTPFPSPIRLRLILIPLGPKISAKSVTLVYACAFSPFALMSSSACAMSIRCGVSKSLKLWIRSPPTLFRYSTVAFVILRTSFR